MLNPKGIVKSVINPDDIKILIIKKCPKLLRIYGTIRNKPLTIGPYWFPKGRSSGVGK